MRILHISDLHFGNHDMYLQNDLARRVKTLELDLIICTGDIADEPAPIYLKEGLDYLNDLRNVDNSKQIPLIVVPGNHDYRESGFLFKDWTYAYKQAFAGYYTALYLERVPVSVWVFGFDSSALGEFGGSGRVDPNEIEKFHAAYDALSARPGFENAFKIVALHHHPLPVTRRHSTRAKWLTLVNSGQFLTAMLFRKINLILHGHEHLQAQSEFWSTLGDNQHKIAVSSLGATLRKMKKEEERNWFSIITIDEKEVKADFYSPVGQAWSPTPTANSYVIRSTEISAELDWKKRRDEKCYFYRELASITVLDQDGDAQRAVECEDLTILKTCDRKELHSFRLPATSGLLACLRAQRQDGAKIEVVGAAPVERGKPWDASLRFKPAVNKTASYVIRWHALNAFAMDQRQFDYQYGREPGALDNTEYTHYEVQDPVEELTVVVQFPHGFAPATKPAIRITTPDPAEQDSRKWKNELEVQNKLEEFHALHFYPSLNVAALRVKRPSPNLSYGIEWRVPAVPPDEWRLQKETLKESAKKWKHMSQDDENKLLRTMLRIIVAARASFLLDVKNEEWSGPIGATIMYFDGLHTLEIVIAAVQQTSRSEIEGVQFELKLRYGDSIAGRAFKANRFRVYVAPDRNTGDEDVPDYYQHFPDAPDFKVVVALPLHVPENDVIFRENPRIYESRRPYGVLNIDSVRADCPLALLRNIEKMAHVLAFQHVANQMIFHELTSIFR